MRPLKHPQAYSFLFSCILQLLYGYNVHAQSRINRQQLVQRHIVTITNADPLSSLSVGNGKFAFTVDITGLQSFPAAYAKGIPLGTQSDWGWHSFPDTVGYRFEESLKEYNFNGRNVTYAVQWSAPERQKRASDWFRQNAHRLQLGNVGFEMIKKDRSDVEIDDIKNIHQQLDPWTGVISTHFTVEDIPVDVLTVASQEQDLVSVRVRSDLVTAGRLKIRLRFPYPTGEFADAGDNYKNGEKHHSAIRLSDDHKALTQHDLDNTHYFVLLTWKNKASISQKDLHYFLVSPSITENTFEFNFRFSPKELNLAVPAFSNTLINSQQHWKDFWTNGGAVDFSGSTDPRANELERRVILSQYLTKIQCAGSYPPQETGLTYNSWYGKPHLEMHWWHGVHFVLWNRPALLEKSLSWYRKAAPIARHLASRQGFQGVRWQKMTDTAGNESPSSVGAFLIWQQPHFIYFAELCYRARPAPRTLDQYKELVFATAEFMASFAMDHKENGKYILGKGVIPAQERFKPEQTFNPTFELVYWRWALTVAQQWRERLHLSRSVKWDEVLANLSPLPQSNGLYLAAESAPDSYTNEVFKTDHPAVLCAYGMLPKTSTLDTAIMRRTFDWVWNNWAWNDTWGWDFPMVAMTATRLYLPEKAMDALFMNIKTNTYLPNGHNYQDDRLRLYLPGNGGLLAAVALMCAGWDGSKEKNPGIPKNGEWNVRWEGLRKMF